MTIGRSLVNGLLAVTVLASGGCGLAPHSFRKLQPPDAVTRARTVGQVPRDPDTPGTTTLVARLEDEDPVVRMTAAAELRRRTGQDFGFVAWADADERAAAVARCRTWMKTHPTASAEVRPASQPSQTKPLRKARRRRAHPPPPAPPASTTAEDARS